MGQSPMRALSRAASVSHVLAGTTADGVQCLTLRRHVRSSRSTPLSADGRLARCNRCASEPCVNPRRSARCRRTATCRRGSRRGAGDLADLLDAEETIGDPVQVDHVGIESLMSCALRLPNRAGERQVFVGECWSRRNWRSSTRATSNLVPEAVQRVEWNPSASIALCSDVAALAAPPLES